MIDIQITGLDALRQELRDFSERRFRAAVATALTRTARGVVREWRQVLESRIDRPLPQTRNAAKSDMATANTLAAKVFLANVGGQGNTPPAEVLGPLERGGTRGVKRFEAALVAAGAMPAGTKALPGPACQLDGYGNPRRAQLVSVLNQLGAQLSPGYQRVVARAAAKRRAAAARSGRVYVAIPRQVKRLKPGVYERKGKRGLLAVFYFVSRVSYRPTLDLIGTGVRYINRDLQAQLDRAISESASRLAARSSAP